MRKDIKIAILYIATGQYIKLWESFYINAMKYFLYDIPDKTFFIWSDSKPKLYDNVIYTYTPWVKQPDTLLDRYDIFLTRKNDLLNYDYCIFFNANMLCIKELHSSELLYTSPNLFAAEHMSMPYMSYEDKYKLIKDGYWSNEPNSKAYIPIEVFKNNPELNWLMGGFNGGKVKDWIQLSETISEWVKVDRQNNIKMKWFDEAYMNKYMLDKNVLRLSPKIFLQPEYNETDETKIIIRDKNRILGDDYRKRKTHLPGLLERIHEIKD